MNLLVSLGVCTPRDGKGTWDSSSPPSGFVSLSLPDILTLTIDDNTDLFPFIRQAHDRCNAITGSSRAARMAG